MTCGHVNHTIRISYGPDDGPTGYSRWGTTTDGGTEPCVEVDRDNPLTPPTVGFELRHIIGDDHAAMLREVANYLDEIVGRTIVGLWAVMIDGERFGFEVIVDHDEDFYEDLDLAMECGHKAHTIRVLRDDDDEPVGSRRYGQRLDGEWEPCPLPGWTPETEAKATT